MPPLWRSSSLHGTHLTLSLSWLSFRDDLPVPSPVPDRRPHLALPFVACRHFPAFMFASDGDDDFDDPGTCGTFAIRRLCVCGLGFALLPPTSENASAAAADKSRKHKASRDGAGCVPMSGEVRVLSRKLVCLRLASTSPKRASRVPVLHQPRELALRSLCCQPTQPFVVF